MEQATEGDSLGKWSPEKPCKLVGRQRNIHRSVLWKAASVKGRFQAQFTLLFKREKIFWREVVKKVRRKL